jgi:hypothetical protein
MNARLRTQLHAELDTNLIGRISGGPEPGDQGPGSRDNRRGGVLKGLIGLLHQGGTILSQTTHHRAFWRLVDLNQQTTAPVEWKFDQTLHQIPQQQHGHQHAVARQLNCQEPGMRR